MKVETQNQFSSHQTDTFSWRSFPSWANLRQFSQVRQPIVFIDSQVENYPHLATGVAPDAEVIILNSTQNGIEQITAALELRPYPSSIHIISHGSPGCLYLGNTQLNLHNLNRYAPQLKNWALETDSAPILLYGCNVASGDEGAEFIANLYQLTGADIAASAYPTGNPGRGGNWDLEVTTNEIRVPLALSPQAMASYDGILVLPIDNLDANYENLPSDDSQNYTIEGVGNQAGTTFNHNFLVGNENNLIISGFTAGGQTYSIVESLDDIQIRRVDNAAVTGDRDLIWFEQDSLTGNNLNLRPSAVTEMEDALFGNIINRGTDNVFTNQGNSDGNNSDIERIDFLDTNGLSSSGAGLDGTGFLILERGGNDRFRIAAITAVDAQGNPTEFGSLVQVNRTDFGESSFQIDTAITRQDEGDANLRYSVTRSGQSIGGVFVSYRDLGIEDGQVFYGYGIFPPDVNNNNDLVGLSDFPTNTNENNGGLDLIAGGIAFISDALTTIDITVAEDAGSGVIIVSLDSASDAPVTVDFTTVDGTAVAPSDYETTSGTLTFAPGETQATIDVPIVEDDIPEGDENFSIVFSNPSNSSISTNTVVITISDVAPTPDPIPTITVAAGSGGEDTGNAPLVVSLDAPSDTPVTVDFTTVDGTATAPDDYETTSGTLTFAPGETQATIDVPIVEDDIPEGDETFDIVFSNPSNGDLPTDTVTVTISDAAPIPTITVAAGSGGEDTGDAPLVVSLDAPSDAPVTVDFTTVDGTATAPDDYETTSGTLTFAPGETQVTIDVPIVEDDIPEGDETFDIVFSNPSNGDLPTDTVTVTISDAAPIPTITVAAGSGGEDTGNAPLVVSLDAPSDTPVTVDFTTVDGTAVAPSDYETTSGTLTFAPGETQVTIDVPIVEDDIPEGDETFDIVFSNPSNGDLPTDTVTVTISDAAPIPTITVAAGSGGEDTGNAPLVVSLDAPSDAPVTVDFTTVDGTAVAPSDYETTSGTLTFAPGETQVTIDVPIVEDDIPEGDETFDIVFSNPSNGDLPTDTVTVTISDAAPIPTITVAAGSGGEDTGNAPLVVSLDAPSDTPVTVDFTTVDGTAVAPSDYETTSGTLTFAPGETQVTIDVPIVEDDIPEGDETFDIVFSNPSNGDLPTDTVTVTISDSQPDTFTLTEDASGDVLNLDGPAGENATLEFTLDSTDAFFINEVGYYIVDDTNGIVDGVAPGDANYLETVLNSGEVIFSVLRNTDTLFGESPNRIVEGLAANEQLGFFLVANSTVDQVLEDIANTGSTATDVLFSVDGANVDGAEQTQFVNVGTNAFTVQWEDEVAGGDQDFNDLTFTVAITEEEPPLGNTFQGEIEQEIFDFRGVDGQFQASLDTLSNSNLGSTVGFYVVNDTDGNITDPTTGVTLSPGDADYVQTAQDISVLELSNPTDSLILDGGEIYATYLRVGQDVFFSFIEANTDGIDHVRLLGDNTLGFEDEIGGGDLDFDDLVIKITDVDLNPAPIPTPTITVAAGSGGEDTGNAPLVVSLDGPSSVPVTVDFTTVDGTAVAPSDYETTSGTLTFAPGETQATIDVPIVEDDIPEGDETFDIVFSNPSNGDLPTDTVTVTISDADPIPTITVAAGSGGEDTGSTPLVVSLDGPSSVPVTVDFTTVDGTAVAPSDYETTSGTLTFAPGETQATIDVPIVEDDIPEGDETFDIVFSNPSNGDLPTDTVTVTISDSQPDTFTLTEDASGDVLNLGGPAGEDATLEFTLDSTDAFFINEVGYYVVDDANGTVDGVAPGDENYLETVLDSGEVIFSVLRNADTLFGEIPNRIVDDFTTNQQLGFFLVANSTADQVLEDIENTGTTATNVFFSVDAANVGGAEQTQFSVVGTNSLTVQWEDAVAGGDQDFNDLTFTVAITEEEPPLGNDLQGDDEQEVFDFRDVDGQVQASFSTLSNSNLASTVGFYVVNDTDGNITDPLTGATLSPDDADYVQTAQDISAVELNGETDSVVLDGGAIYATYLAVESGDVFFSFIGANSDGIDHVRLLGDNTLGFEDELGGGDLDYNDRVIKFDSVEL